MEQETIEKAAKTKPNYTWSNPILTVEISIHTGKDSPQTKTTTDRIWIARDKDGMLCAYNKKPDRYAFEGIWQPENGNVSNCGVLDGDWFPEVTWENSPIELVPKIMIDKNTSLEDKL